MKSTVFMEDEFCFPGGPPPCTRLDRMHANESSLIDLFLREHAARRRRRACAHDGELGASGLRDQLGAQVFSQQPRVQQQIVLMDVGRLPVKMRGDELRTPAVTQL